MMMMMNGECVRKRIDPGLFQGNITQFTRRNGGKPREFSVRVAGNPTDIRR